MRRATGIVVLIFAAMFTMRHGMAGEKTSFAEVTAELEQGGEFYLYMSTEQAFADIDGWIVNLKDKMAGVANEDPEQAAAIDQGIDFALKIFRGSGLRDINGVGMSSVRDPGGFYRSRFFVYRQPDRNQGIIWQMAVPHHDRLVGMNLAPPDAALGYFFEANPVICWTWLSKEIRASGIKEMQDWFDKTLAESRKNGIDLDALIASLAGEAGLFVTLDPGVQTVIPLGDGKEVAIPEPGILLAFKVKDETIFNVIQAKMMPKDQPEGQGMAGRADQDGKLVLQFKMGIPYLPGPAVLVQADGYLLFGSCMKIVDRALAVNQGKLAGLATTDQYREVSKGLPDQGNGFLYVSPFLAKSVVAFQRDMLGQADEAEDASARLVMELFMGDERPRWYCSIMQNRPDGAIGYGNSTQSMTTTLALQATVAPAAIMAGMLLPALSMSREKARRISCASNMKQIGLGLRMYSSDHDEMFPAPDGAAGLELLRQEGYLENPRIYACPSADGVTAPTGQPLTEETVSYIYFGGMSEADSVDLPLVIDKPDNHQKYVNVLYIDGHVSGYTLPAGQARTCEGIITFLIDNIQDLKEADRSRLLEKARAFDRISLGQPSAVPQLELVPEAR